MTILDRKLWAGLLILAAVSLISSAAVFGGIEWALASLGAMALIGMIVTGICIAIRISKYSYKPVFEEFINYESMSYAWDDNDLAYVTAETTEVAAPISKKDKRLMMKHIDELFEIAQEQSEEKPAEAEPISNEDKRLIMVHIDKLFETDWEQSQQILS